MTIFGLFYIVYDIKNPHRIAGKNPESPQWICRFFSFNSFEWPLFELACTFFWL